MKQLQLSLSILTLLGITIANVKAEENPEATQVVRNTVAISILKAESEVALIYAKGLCCASCGIGVRKKISKLDFVDKKRFNKGVVLDAKTQLVTIALIKGKSAVSTALATAVEDAGYDPMHIYTLKEGKLRTKALSSK